MASHVVVIDTSFRKFTIKVNPGKYMSDVRDEACAKAKLDAGNYGLKNNNKQVDLSRTFRQTGLSSGAKLELVLASRSPSVVSVALQLPEADAKAIPGGRLTKKFSSNSTLWHLLRAFESSGSSNFNFTGRGVAQTESGGSGAGRIYYEQPVLNIMGRELSSFTDLQKTLAALGFNAGSCLIRLTFRRSETPLEEAMAEIEQYFKSLEKTENAGAQVDTVGNGESLPSVELSATPAIAAGGPETSTSMDVDSAVPDSSSSDAAGAVMTPATPSEASAPEEVLVGPNQRPMSIFAAPSGETPQAALGTFNEADYEPSIAHAKLHQARLQNNSQNQRLLSDAEVQALAEEKAAKQAAIKDVSVKVRFPSQHTAVADFSATDTGLSLYDFVQGVIVPDTKPYELSWMGLKGPQIVPKDPNVRLIRDLGFAQRMVVNFNYEDEEDQKNARTSTILKPEFLVKAKELQVQEIAATVEDDEEEKASSSKPVQKPQENSGGEKKKGGLPKWLKGLPGKK